MSESLVRDLARCFRRRRIAPKFHYISNKQSELWLRIHSEYAPADIMVDPYLESALHIPDNIQALISLGCGAGEKEISIIKELNTSVVFIPTDISMPLVLTAAKNAASCDIKTGVPLVFDLANDSNLDDFLRKQFKANRLFTCFGILPNFAPADILPQIYRLINGSDLLLLSANLAPSGIESILPQYDNNLTKIWLGQLLVDNAVYGGKIDVRAIETDLHHWIQADYIFESDIEIKISGETISFNVGEKLELFVSYRYTLQSLESTLNGFGIQIENSFISENGEEGVFLCSTQ